jgi:hypothetical protein
MEKHMISIPRTPSIQEERPVAPVEQLTRRNDGDTYRSKTDDRSELLTDFQRAALRWLSSFD